MHLGPRIFASIVPALVVTGPICAELTAPKPIPGSVIKAYGQIYTVSDPIELADPSAGLKAVFDVADDSDAPEAPNSRIVRIARYLNLHAAAGFPRDRLAAVLVLHGKATASSLSHAAYRERHGFDNPDLPLLEALRSAGVEIYLCGQSASKNGFARDEIAEPVEVALSAMTVLVQLQSAGYGLIAF